VSRKDPLVLKPGEHHHALRAGTVKRIHIRGAAVAACTAGNPEPCITIQTTHGPFHCADCEWDGPTKLVERINDPLNSGARIWIETKAEIRVTR
jgi:hypothetical protein